ncbi:MAG TPA: gliding motility-associated C-terminal domain-containing protein [Bacteroidales bacterium]|nr:gliding motility-associated C-terminal domain-containing protein [Bacteroidales bacterium]
MRYNLILIALFIPLTGMAQLSAPLANAVRLTSYPVTTGRSDPVFIFCRSSGFTSGSVQASSPGGTAPFNFSWYGWNNSQGSFSDSLKTDVSVPGSTATNLGEGGYRVHITDGSGYDTSLYAWVFIDGPYANARLQNFTCEYVALNGTAAVDTFYYYEPANGTKVKLKNGYTFLWSSDPSSAIPYPGIYIDPVTFSPPLEDVVYKLQVADSFQCSSESSFPYTSIHVKADFQVDPNEGQAPLKVSFTDKSIRGETYKWEFGDDSISYLKDPGIHTYYRPGEYSIKLTIESNLHCVDSLRYNKITVDKSEMSIPNVFTPDGDGLNDYFVVEAKSLRSINVEIYSRSGLRVYSFSGQGEALADWKGWDGNVNNSSIKAAPGVYYYIIRAVGWDDVVYDGKAYRGFLYLYR